MRANSRYQKDSAPPYQKLIEQYGEEGMGLILLVYVNFYFSEINIINLCGRWIPRRHDFIEKSYLVTHAADEVTHAKLFREGVERLGIEWNSLDHDKYRVHDIGERFDKLLKSDDELEVLIGLNLYAEGVLALEEIHQLAKSRPDIFYQFDRIYRDEQTHLRFGAVVARRMIEESEQNRARAQAHCQWYEDHLSNYLDGELSDKIQRAVDLGFVTSDYIDCTKRRFRNVMGELGLTTHI